MHLMRKIERVFFPILRFADYLDPYKHLTIFPSAEYIHFLFALVIIYIFRLKESVRTLSLELTEEDFLQRSQTLRECSVKTWDPQPEGCESWLWHRLWHITKVSDLDSILSVSEVNQCHCFPVWPPSYFSLDDGHGSRFLWITLWYIYITFMTASLQALSLYLIGRYISSMSIHTCARISKDIFYGLVHWRLWCWSVCWVRRGAMIVREEREARSRYRWWPSRCYETWYLQWLLILPGVHITEDVIMSVPLLPLIVSVLVTMAGSDPGAMLPTISPSYLRMNTQVKKVKVSPPGSPSNLQVICGTIVLTVYTQARVRNSPLTC